jgi:hypothetical protein
MIYFNVLHLKCKCNKTPKSLGLYVSVFQKKKEEIKYNAFVMQFLNSKTIGAVVIIMVVGFSTTCAISAYHH